MNQVQILKSRFEKLNNSSEITDALDLTPIRVKKEPQLKFARSATCIDFSKFRLSEVKKDPVKNTADKPAIVRPQPPPTFQRQLSNSSNTSQKSIRRSPAFRFDAHCRPSIVKNVTKDELDKRKTELEYLQSSVTIKKALMRPLPQGSPPKKPPRMFLSPQTVKADSPPKESRLQKLKISPNTLPKQSPGRSDDKKAISSFLNCIISPCSIDPIYYEQIRREQKQPREEPEQIYMEPYAHLHKDFQNNVKEELHYMCTDLNGSADFNGNSPSKDDADDHRRSSLEASDIEDYEKASVDQFSISFVIDFAFLDQFIVQRRVRREASRQHHRRNVAQFE